MIRELTKSVEHIEDVDEQNEINYLLRDPIRYLQELRVYWDEDFFEMIFAFREAVESLAYVELNEAYDLDELEEYIEPVEEIIKNLQNFLSVIESELEKERAKAKVKGKKKSNEK